MGQKNVKNEVCEAYYWLAGHPCFWPIYKSSNGLMVLPKTNKGMYDGVEITPHMVDPDKDEISDNEKLNTKLQYWCEVFYSTVDEQFPSVDKFRGTYCHDYKLDCGADTYDEAIILVAKKVKKFYGDYKINRSERTVSITKNGVTKKFIIYNKKKETLKGTDMKGKKCNFSYCSLRHIPYKSWKASTPWNKD